MYYFVNDYSEGAHPSVLQALCDTNGEQTLGYGTDPYTARATALIREKVADPTVDVHFLVGGTQVNLVCVHAFLRSFEAVIATQAGHVYVHETGAIEATGHKVFAVPSPDGKLTPAMVEAALAAHNGTEHMVHPRLVYISDTTEIGTVYSLAELRALRACCDRHGLYLYCDGARLAPALTTQEGRMTLAELSACCDAFTIGGTKNGLLFGEALVIRNDALKTDFRCYMKQRGALLAKGRLLGIQFYEILKDDLYFTLGRHANDMAAKLRQALTDAGCRFISDSPSNQQFVYLPIKMYEALSRDFTFEDESSPADPAGCIGVRLCTSWATDEAAVDRLAAAIRAF